MPPQGPPEGPPEPEGKDADAEPDGAPEGKPEAGPLGALDAENTAPPEVPDALRDIGAPVTEALYTRLPLRR